MEDNKVYQWQPDDKISISGAEFNILFNGIGQFMRTPLLTPYSVLGIADAEIATRAILDRMVKEGLAKEVVEEAPKKMEVPEMNREL